MNKTIHLTDNGIRNTGVRAGMQIQSESAVLKGARLVRLIDQDSQELISWKIYIAFTSTFVPLHNIGS
jgi:hypothetical protein